jgi:hypothetical protein
MFGKLTTKPIKNPKATSKNSGTKPKLIKVRTKDIAKDMPKDIKAPNKTVEYLSLNFMKQPKKG